MLNHQLPQAEWLQMDCCAFQRLSKPWPKQRMENDGCFAPRHAHSFLSKKLIQGLCEKSNNQAKELDPYIYIIAVEILKKILIKSPLQASTHQKCKSSSLYSCSTEVAFMNKLMINHLCRWVWGRRVSVFQKTTCQCIKKEVLPQKQHVKLFFLVKHILMFSNYTKVSQQNPPTRVGVTSKYLMQNPNGVDWS